MFTIYPALDLRTGKVVRLMQGDPQRLTLYGEDPAAVARRWLEQGARWLHVVNLDGALGEADAENRRALLQVLRVTQEFQAQVQFGGGLRSLESVEDALAMGVHRVVLGTMVIEQPQALLKALERFGAERVAVALDVRDGQLRVRGWQSSAPYSPLELMRHLHDQGVRIFIYTDTSRDGLQSGLDLEGMRPLIGLGEIIASGGVRGLEDVQAARRLGCQGVILGRALYEGKIDLREALNAGKADYSLP
jgi:phosphoribosylformimino-5-aminoimidazole carboxamide ribotide isomerase